VQARLPSEQLVERATIDEAKVDSSLRVPREKGKPYHMLVGFGEVTRDEAWVGFTPLDLTSSRHIRR
jgi:hypothetical protein